MKFCVSTDVVTWTNWLTFQPDQDHSPDPGTGFTPAFWILAGYLNKLWTDFDEILWVDSWEVCTIWLRFEPDPDQSPDSGSGHVFKIARRIALSSNGRISIKFYKWIACESRKTAFNFGSDIDHIRDAVSVSGFYPDYWLRQILTKFGQRWRLRQGSSTRPHLRGGGGYGIKPHLPKC